MIQIDYPDRSLWPDVLKRPVMNVESLFDTVRGILQRVQAEGDSAVLDYEWNFDKVKLSSLAVTEEEMKLSEDLITESLKNAIHLAAQNIHAFHAAQRFAGCRVETQPGVVCWQKAVPIERVGLYIPGGTAPLFSTVLMLAVPARIAGCKDIILCTPPMRDGKVHPAVLYAAKVAGVKYVFKAGGVQAIAAMAYGTETVPKVYKIFGFDYTVELSTRPENSMGSDEQWNMAEGALKKVLKDMEMPYEINEGDGAFYGPKIDFHIKDSLGREWQCGTIQLDFQMPERFDLTYIGEDGEKHRPVMLHRVIFGSIERFIGVLIENYAGAFPTWLAPVQVKILPITDAHIDYANDVKEKLENVGIRVEVDDRNEKIGYKIREAQLQKIPYMLVVGEKEKEARTVGVRSRKSGDIGQMPVDEFISKIQEEIETKAID